ncbi:hypothetical protein [Dokdonella sp.]|uniref:hypothetical protein n=1 Tax=Dokdonella sp. TaxID=2291710 RepID=UPI0031BE1AA5|nr:hypothetical protein [Dokdonella sp.]
MSNLPRPATERTGAPPTDSQENAWPDPAGERRRMPQGSGRADSEALADPEDVRRAFRKWRIGDDA